MVAMLPDRYTILEEALRRNVATAAEFAGLATVDLPPTVQAKIAMSCPPDGLEAVGAIRESEGLILYSSDHDAREAQKKLCSCEGIYAEPSAAVSLVGVEKLLKMNQAGGNQSIVAIVTGSGFRETGAISNMVSVTPVPITPEAGIGVLEDILARWGRRNASKEE
jgi:threonine synthase